MSAAQPGLAQLLLDPGAAGPASDASDASELLAIGWATVDTERTLRELPGIHARPGPDDELLGARSTLLGNGPVAVALLEPITEGRLAAALARHGEGIVALYLRDDAPANGPLRQTAIEAPGRLAPHDKPWGPFVIRVSASAPDGSSDRAPVARPP